MHKKIKFVEVKSELGAGTRGASLGPDAIKIAAFDYGSSLFNKIPTVSIPVDNKILFQPQGSPYAKRLSDILNIYESLGKVVSDTMKAKEFPIVLAGDHSTSGGTIAGIKMANPKARLGVIWIDAHAGINTLEATVSKNRHGTTLASATRLATG